MNNKDKERVLNGLISMLENQLFTGTGDNFEVWFDGLYDEEENDFLQNEEQKQLVKDLSDIVTDISYQLSDDSE